MTGEWVYKTIFNGCITAGVEESRARIFANDGEHKYLGGNFKGKNGGAIKLIEHQIKLAKGKGKK